MELIWNAGIGKVPYKPVYSGLDTEYIVKGSRMRTGRNYVFFVRASNSCGFGPNSEINSMVKMTAPAKMARGKITQTSCGVKISWSKTNNGGSPITSFSVAIRQSNGKYTSVPFCGNKAETGPLSCDVPASVLEAEPYKLIPGQLIVVRTVALNASGYGKSSSAFSGGQTFKNNKPRRMYTPKLYKKTNNSIELRWTNLPRRNGVEGDRVYNLYWNRGGDREPLSQLVERIADNKYTVTGLEPNTIYKFKLRAVNDCGAGPFSRVETATTYSCPASPSVITTSRDGANLVLNWEDKYAKTNRFNKAKVTSY